MSGFSTDPEIAADLVRRAQSERDRSRSREAEGIGDSAIVAHWPCSGGCNTMVAIPRAQLEAHDAFNALLRKRREPELPKRGECDACRERRRATEQAERDRQRDLSSKPRQTQIPVEPQRPSWMPTPRKTSR
jgi:hypothetical protein